MRLKNIKLAGFKSFVDPTTVPFQSNMTAIVGPNGCGKSNVIDAVRWVMGESSARHLRGESMTDVIFNGSTSRKLVSRASIELVFDNSEGRAAGEFAKFAEIVNLYMKNPLEIIRFTQNLADHQILGEDGQGTCFSHLLC